MALLLGLAMLPAGAIAMQMGLNAASAQQAALEESLGRRALQSIQVERTAINELRELVRLLATAPTIQQYEAGSCRRWLSEVVAEYRDIAAISLTDGAGRVVCSIPEAPAGMRVPDSPLRHTAIARDDFTIGFVGEGPLTGVPVVAALGPVRDSEGRRVGFIGVSITLSRLQELLDQSGPLDTAHAAIIDGQGRVLVESIRGENVPALPPPQALQNLRGAEPLFVDVAGGDAVIVPLHAPDLYVAMSWRPDQPAWRLFAGYAISVAAPLLIWLLAVAAGWFAIEIYVARPLSTLETAARSMARGEVPEDGGVFTNAPSEIRSLRRTLAAMAKTLRGREQRLVEALGEERALLREVHHRVKNNLQMVASLLSIQARGSKDESEAWGLARAHDRVQLLSQVHQRIYASGEVREIRLDELTADIARQMIAGRGTVAQKLKLDLDLKEARVPADRAVPLAFLVGEGLSTALDVIGEHGGGPLDATTLRLWLKQDEDGTLRFAVDSDAGEGGVAPATAARLIDAFARQLGAQIGRHPERAFMMWASVPPLPRYD